MFVFEKLKGFGLFPMLVMRGGGYVRGTEDQKY